MSEGFTLLKAVTKKEYLVQPSGTLQPFIDHGQSDLWFTDGRFPKAEAFKGCWQYDKNAAYLAAACSVKVGVGNYEHSTADSFEDIPALWRVYCETSGANGIVPVSTGESWQYTPVLREWLFLGVVFTVREAYYWPESKRVFYSFYEHLKARREAGESVKHLYLSAFGMLAHKPGRVWKGCIYRPDWYNLMKAQNRFLLSLQARQVYEAEGIWPIAAKIDALIYERQVHTLKLGTGIGAYKESQL